MRHQSPLRDAVLSVRLPASDLDRLRLRAEEARLSLAEYVRTVLSLRLSLVPDRRVA